MNVVQLIAEHAALLLVLFAVGCVVSFVRESRKDISAKTSRILKTLEWCLLPPGFAVIFITVQQWSVYYFALHPEWTIAACLAAAAFSALLILARRKKRHGFLAWLGGLAGVPGVAFSLILVGLYFQSRPRFEDIRATYNRLAATEGEMAPDVAFTLLSSREKRQLADFRGKVVLLNIWATWCVPCRKEMPDLNQLQKKFGHDGLAVINLSDESLSVIDRYLSEHPMVTTHGRVDRGEVPAFYQFGGVRPTTFVIGRNGEVVESIVGGKNLKYFEKAVLRPLAVKLEKS